MSTSPATPGTRSSELGTHVRVFGLLPFRGLGDPKSRLGSVLDLQQRRALALHLLRRSISAMFEGGIERLAIVTIDEGLERVGLDPRVELLIQPGTGLNAAIRQGQAWAVHGGADSLMILLPDLPLVTSDDVRALLAASHPDRTVIAPDRHGTGTNALVLSPPDALAPAYGRNSAIRHRLALALADTPAVDIQRPGIHLDLDTPDDLEYIGTCGA